MSLKLVKLVKSWSNWLSVLSVLKFVPSFFLINLGQTVWTWTRCSLRDSHRGFRGAIGVVFKQLLFRTCHEIHEIYGFQLRLKISVE